MTLLGLVRRTRVFSKPKRSAFYTVDVSALLSLAVSPAISEAADSAR